MISYQIWAFYQKCCTPACAQESGRAFLEHAVRIGTDLGASCIFVISVKNSAQRGISHHIYTLTPSQKPQEKLFFVISAGFCSSVLRLLHFTVVCAHIHNGPAIPLST